MCDCISRHVVSSSPLLSLGCRGRSRGGRGGGGGGGGAGCDVVGTKKDARASCSISISASASPQAMAQAESAVRLQECGWSSACVPGSTKAAVLWGPVPARTCWPTWVRYMRSREPWSQLFSREPASFWKLPCAKEILMVLPNCMSDPTA